MLDCVCFEFAYVIKLSSSFEFPKQERRDDLTVHKPNLNLFIYLFARSTFWKVVELTYNTVYRQI